MSKLDNLCENQQNAHSHLKCKIIKRALKGSPQGDLCKTRYLLVGWLLFEMLPYSENIFHCP